MPDTFVTFFTPGENRVVNELFTTQALADAAALANRHLTAYQGAVILEEGADEIRVGMYISTEGKALRRRRLPPANALEVSADQIHRIYRHADHQIATVTDWITVNNTLNWVNTLLSKWYWPWFYTTLRLYQTAHGSISAENVIAVRARVRLLEREMVGIGPMKWYDIAQRAGWRRKLATVLNATADDGTLGDVIVVPAFAVPADWDMRTDLLDTLDIDSSNGLPPGGRRPPRQIPPNRDEDQGGGRNGDQGGGRDDN